MLHIYLDESGDIGLKLDKQSATRHFVISILVVRGVENNRALISAIKKTLKRKLNPRNKRKRIVTELKGTKIDLKIKKYFYGQIEHLDFEIYSVVVKKESLKVINSGQPRFYNYISRMVLGGIILNDINSSIDLIVDKSKNRPEIKRFNNFIKSSLEGKINPSVPFRIYHMESDTSAGLQAIDLFCHGIFEKYERGSEDWYDIFEGKIKTLSFYP
jgi:hypothetical protein